MKRRPFRVGIMFDLCMLGLASAGPGVTGTNASICICTPTQPFFNSKNPQTHPPIMIQTEMYLFKRRVAKKLESENFVKGVQARQIKTTGEVTL
jgi:hypothetical protein